VDSKKWIVVSDYTYHIDYRNIPARAGLRNWIDE